MPRRTTKSQQPSPTITSTITILGLLKPTGWDIPDELRQVEIDDVDIGILQVTLESGKTYAIDRSGVNFGIPQSDWDEIHSRLQEQLGFTFTDLEVIPIQSGSGKNISDYSPEGGKAITRFIRSYPSLSKRLLSAFTSPC